MRVWVDLTNSPHVLVFRPLIALLRERGHEVEMTAREYAQTLELLELHGIDGEGRRAPRRRLDARRRRGPSSSRLPALRRWAKPRGFDLALAHGSHDLTLTARSLGIPSATTFDYEFAWLQHQLGCRAATRVVVPEAIPAERLARYGARPPKLRRYPGLKEEYYLADFEPDRGRRSPDGKRARGRPHARRRCRSTTATATRCSVRCSSGSAATTRVHAVVLPRTEEQRESIRALGAPLPGRPRPRGRCAEPDRGRRPGRLRRRDDEPRGGRAGNARSTRRSAGRLGAVDEGLIREGRLVRLERRGRARPGPAPAAARAAPARPERPARPSGQLISRSRRRNPRSREAEMWPFRVSATPQMRVLVALAAVALVGLAIGAHSAAAGSKKPGVSISVDLGPASVKVDTSSGGADASVDVSTPAATVDAAVDSSAQAPVSAPVDTSTQVAGATVDVADSSAATVSTPAGSTTVRADTTKGVEASVKSSVASGKAAVSAGKAHADTKVSTPTESAGTAVQAASVGASNEGSPAVALPPRTAGTAKPVRPQAVGRPAARRTRPAAAVPTLIPPVTAVPRNTVVAGRTRLDAAARIHRCPRRLFSPGRRTRA